MKIEHANSEAVAKRAFFLAWKACGGPSGMGILQDKGDVTEADVWKNALGREDYPGGISIPGMGLRKGKAYGDYVFGRMMKLLLTFDETGVSFEDKAPDRSYNAWCSKYPTFQALVEAAIADLAKSEEAKTN